MSECASRRILLFDSATTQEELAVSLGLLRSHGNIRVTAGWNPANLDESLAAEMVAKIKESSDQVAAVGEIGLDRYWVRERTQWEKQERIMRMFLDLADALDKPVVIHSRSAGEACLEILRSSGFKRVLMHAYDGSAPSATRAASDGYLFSIPPSIVRSPQKIKMARRLPAEALTLESDAPVLAPVRGERNYPWNIVVAASKIGELKGLPTERVLASTRDKALTFYGLESLFAF